MRQVLQVVSWTLSLTLNVLVLAELGKGLYRRFPFVFLYCIALLVSTTLEIVAVSLALDIDLYYWLDDVVRQGLMFTLVISLIHGAMEPAAGEHPTGFHPRIHRNWGVDWIGGTASLGPAQIAAGVGVDVHAAAIEVGGVGDDTGGQGGVEVEAHLIRDALGIQVIGSRSHRSASCNGISFSSDVCWYETNEHTIVHAAIDAGVRTA